MAEPVPFTRAGARTRVAMGVGVVVSLLFTYLAVRGLDVDAFWLALRTSEPLWIVPSLALVALCVWVRSERWRLLFAPGRRPGSAPTLRATLIGLLFNNVLPARAGEAARVWALHREAGTPRVEAVGTAMSERAYDLLALFAVLALALPVLPDAPWLRSAALLSLVLAVGAAVGVGLVAHHGERPARVLFRPLSRLPKVSSAQTDHAARSLVVGLAGFRSPRLAAQAFALTMLSWLLLGASFWLLMLGFDLGLGLSAGIVVVVATNLAIVLPAAPGGLGVWEAATVVALSAWGVPEAAALSYAVVLHLVNFVPYVVVGYLVLHGHLRRPPVAAASPAGRPMGATTLP